MKLEINAISFSKDFIFIEIRIHKNSILFVSLYLLFDYLPTDILLPIYLLQNIFTITTLREKSDGPGCQCI